MLAVTNVILEADDAYLILASGQLLAGTISHTSIQYIDMSKLSMFHGIFLLFILLALVGVEFPFCLVDTLSQHAITCFKSEVGYKIVLFY